MFVSAIDYSISWQRRWLVWGYITEQMYFPCSQGDSKEALYIMYWIVPVASQVYYFGFSMLPIALFQWRDNTPASKCRSSKHQEIKPNPSTPTSSTEKAVKMTLPWGFSTIHRDDEVTDTTEDKDHYNTATLCDMTLLGGSEDFFT